LAGGGVVFGQNFGSFARALEMCHWSGLQLKERERERERRRESRALNAAGSLCSKQLSGLGVIRLCAAV
jgi:hypothetical protein